MKRLIFLLCSLIMLVCAGAVIGCNNEERNDYVNVIIVDIKNIDEGGTLKDYMDYLHEECNFTYEMNGTMLMSIDGIKPKIKEAWMLYTNDMENADETWGTYEYEGETYYSANLGANELIVKDGYTYIWYLQAY